MATLGPYSTTNDKIKFKIYVTQNSQSVADNTSNVTVKVFFYRTNTGYTTYGSGTVYCKINGTEYTAAVDSSDKITSSGIYLFSKTLNISHSSDGTKKLPVYAKISHSQFDQTTYCGDNVTLTTIPRKSTLTVANGTLGTAQTLTITRKSSSFTHTITATCGSASTTIASKSSSTSFSFTPPLSWASQNTTGTSVTVTYKITTYSGSTSVGTNSYSKTCSIPSSVKPSCSISVSEATSHGAYVKGLSKLKIVVTPTTSYGSAIASYSTTANGSTYTTATITTGVLSAAGTLKITATVKDKRGRSGTATKTITVVDKSTLTVGNGTLGTAQTVKITEGHSSFKHKITYSCGDKSGYIAGGSSAFTENTSFNWSPALSLATENTTGTSLSVKVTLYTYTSGGTSVGNVSKTITCTIPDTVCPSIDVSITDAMGYADKYGGYIQGVSKYKVVITPTLAYGSPITSYGATANGTTYSTASFTTGVIKTSGTELITASVVDKRNRIGAIGMSINVLQYSPPTVSKLTVSRCNTDGTPNDEGGIAKVTFSGKVTSLNNKNSATYKIQYKKSTETSYTTVDLTDYADNFAVTDVVYTFNAESGSSYDVQLVIVDDFKTTTKKTSVSTAFTLMHFSAGGTGMGIGKIAENENLLDIGVPVMLRKGFTEKVLYSTSGKYMNSSQTAELSEPISKQNTGIVLAWCTYVDGAALNYNWHFTFIPKAFVTLYSGYAISTGVMTTTNFNRIGQKYVYVSDTIITGHENNNLKGTGDSGITYSNDYWVLRYVFGV